MHSRFSTNTLGSWRLAHPYRYVVHNGEINTLRGNINWMAAREHVLVPELGDDVEKLLPIIPPGGPAVQSDTASFDNALELLLATGRSLPHSMLMLIPEAWADHIPMDQAKRDFYEYHSDLMEPWDGPGPDRRHRRHRVCAILDRNGLRPCRYLVTTDGLLVMASEAGVLDVPPEKVLFKRRIQPGRMFLLDTKQGRLVDDEEIKRDLTSRKPYGEWLRQNHITLEELPEPGLRPRAGPRDRPRAAEGLRLHHGRDPHADRAHGHERAGPGRLHGQRRAPGRAFGHEPAAVQLLPPALCPGLEPASGRDARRVGHLAGDVHRAGAQPLRGDAGALPSAQAQGTIPDQPRAREDPPHYAGQAAARTISTLFQPAKGPGAMKAAMDRLCAEASRRSRTA